MKLALGPYIRFSRILLFPLAMVIYDFSAYLTTDLIQPGIIHIIREFEADVALAPASVSLYLAGGLALQWLLGPLSDRIGRRPVLLTGAIIFALACFSMIFARRLINILSPVLSREPVSASFRQSVMSPSRRLLMKKSLSALWRR
ncbi:Sugar transport protein [Klebsiella pneumoniae]